MGMVYQWSGRNTSKVNPQVVGETIEAIVRREGACTPAHLVNEARSDTSQLHPLFQWNDEVAAESWRTHQARNVINSLSVSVMRGDKETIAPAFISVGHTAQTHDAGIGYRPIAVVLDNPDFTEEALDEAISRLKALQVRYGAIKELSIVWEALEQIIAA